ncbi:MAG: hypothetical protein NT116_00815 [Candidatus Parcubacteria bacterium]|nr:hypothetical protein [Candidatus Parcubacteria bacterium]
MLKSLALSVLVAVLLASCIGPHSNIRKTSTVEVTYPFYTVKVTGAGSNEKTINALGRYGVFDGARVTIEAIQKLTPILAQYGYRARISANEVIIEPIPRDMIIGIENRFPGRTMLVVIYSQNQFVWSDKIAARSAKETILKPGPYKVVSSFVGSTIETPIDIVIPNDEYKDYSPYLKMNVDYLLYWPRA